MNTQEKLARIADLPSLPALLMEALQHTGRHQSISELADKIGRDPPIVIRILRIANSPFYGMSREIGSLREAIVLLGINRVRDILVTACFLNLLPAQHKEFNYRLFWRHSLAVADCGRQLGGFLSFAEDIVFTAGLLHDIGTLVMVLLFPDEFFRISESVHPDRLAVERQILGLDHIEIGSKVALHWNLPRTIQEAIEQHESLPNQGMAVSLGLLIYLANKLVKAAEKTSDFEANELNHAAQVLEAFNIPFEQAKHWANNSRTFADQILTAR